MKEDIMIVEELLQGAKDNGMYDNNKYFYSIENLIKGYRELEEKNRRYEKIYKEYGIDDLVRKIERLEEENEELKRLANNKQWISPCYVAHNYIPKSKVKEVIEELNEEYERKITEDNINHFVYSEQYAIAEEYLKKLMEDK